MAEYYPLLAKAVASLPNSTLESRKVVYDRARKALIGQLRMLHPSVPEEDIERESVALDAAVARVEAELAAAPPPVAGASAPATPSPAAAPPPPRPPEPATARFPAGSGALGPAAAKPFAPLRTKLPPAKPAMPPAGGAAPVSPPEVAKSEVAKSEVAKSEVAKSEVAKSEVAKPHTVKPDTVKPEDAPGLPADTGVADAALAASDAAQPAAEPIPAAGPAPLAVRLPPEGERRARPRTEGQRPIAPQPPEPKRAKRPLWIVPTGIAAVVLGVGLTAYKLRDRPELLRPHQNEQAQAPAEAGKSVDRVGGAGVAAGAETAKTAVGGAAPSGQPDAPASSPVATNPAAPVAGRAALLVEAPEERDKFKTYVGAVVWRLDNVSEGQNQSVALAVRADVDLPDDKMKATIIFQKNVEASLPASHTIKIRFAPQAGSPSGGVKEINVPQMRREDSASGEPLDGVTVAIVENSFLVGLTPGTSEASNLDLLRSREWIDIPIRLTSGKIAKLTFEKTAAGQRNLQEAIAAWAKS